MLLSAVAHGGAGGVVVSSSVIGTCIAVAIERHSVLSRLWRDRVVAAVVVRVGGGRHAGLCVDGGVVTCWLLIGVVDAGNESHAAATAVHRLFALKVQ